jgi:hypothetical protein
VNDSDNDPNLASSVAITERAMAIMKRVTGVNQNTAKSSEMRTTPVGILKRTVSFVPGVAVSYNNNSTKNSSDEDNDTNSQLPNK